MSYLTSSFSADTEALARDFDRQLLARQLDHSASHSRSWRTLWPFFRSEPAQASPVACQCKNTCQSQC